MTEYLTLEEVIRIHEALIADIIEEAAALWESMAMNHGFIDGNKRVAFACVDVFPGMNGIELVAENDAMERFIYHHLEAGTFRKDVLEAWLHEHTRPRACPPYSAGSTSPPPCLTKPSISASRARRRCSSASVASRWRFHICA